MTDYSELVKALRHCVSDEKGVTKCAGCPYYPDITGCMDRLHTDAADAIEDLKAQLPKRGEWIDRYDEDDKPFFKRKYVCSACSHWNTYGKSKYCPNCGAKMEVQE